MVREFVETHGTGIASEQIERLRDAIDAQLSDLMKAARKGGSDPFALKKKKFEKRLTKAVRRDLTPPDEHRTNGISE